MATTISAILRAMQGVVEAVTPSIGAASADDRFRCAIMPTESEGYQINRPRSCVLVSSGPRPVEPRHVCSEWGVTVVLLVFYADNPPANGAIGAGLVAIQDAEDIAQALRSSILTLGVFAIEMDEATTQPSTVPGYFVVMRSVTLTYERST